MEPEIIDTHALVVSGDTHRYPASPLGGLQSTWSTDRAVNAEQMLVAMEEAGVGRSILLQSSTVYGFDNSYLADVVAAHKDRFSGIFSINVMGDSAAADMRRWHARGLAGMRIFAHGSTMQEAWLAIDDPRAAPAWRCAAELGISVSTNAANLAQVESILQRYRDIPLILEHVVRPEIPDGPPYDGVRDLWAFSKYKNLFLKVTPRTFAATRRGKARPETYVQKLTQEFGASRLLWGSYFPPTPTTLAEIVRDARAVLDALPLSDRNWILCKTAEKLFPASSG